MWNLAAVAVVEATNTPVLLEVFYTPTAAVSERGTDSNAVNPNTPTSDSCLGVREEDGLQIQLLLFEAIDKCEARVQERRREDTRVQRSLQLCQQQQQQQQQAAWMASHASGVGSPKRTDVPTADTISSSPLHATHKNTSPANRCYVDPRTSETEPRGTAVHADRDASCYQQTTTEGLGSPASFNRTLKPPVVTASSPNLHSTIAGRSMGHTAVYGGTTPLTDGALFENSILTNGSHSGSSGSPMTRQERHSVSPWASVNSPSVARHTRAATSRNASTDPFGKGPLEPPHGVPPSTHHHHHNNRSEADSESGGDDAAAEQRWKEVAAWQENLPVAASYSSLGKSTTGDHSPSHSYVSVPHPGKESWIVSPPSPAVGGDRGVSHARHPTTAYVGHRTGEAAGSGILLPRAGMASAPSKAPLTPLLLPTTTSVPSLMSAPPEDGRSTTGGAAMLSRGPPVVGGTTVYTAVEEGGRVGDGTPSASRFNFCEAVLSTGSAMPDGYLPDVDDTAALWRVEQSWLVEGGGRSNTAVAGGGLIHRLVRGATSVPGDPLPGGGPNGAFAPSSRHRNVWIPLSLPLYPPGTNLFLLPSASPLASPNAPPTPPHPDPNTHPSSASASVMMSPITQCPHPNGAAQNHHHHNVNTTSNAASPPRAQQQHGRSRSGAAGVSGSASPRLPAYPNSSAASPPLTAVSPGALPSCAVSSLPLPRSLRNATPLPSSRMIPTSTACAAPTWNQQLITSGGDPRYVGKVASTGDGRLHCFAFCAATGMKAFVVTVSEYPNAPSSRTATSAGRSPTATVLPIHVREGDEGDEGDSAEEEEDSEDSDELSLGHGKLVVPHDDAMLPITRAIFETASSALCNPFQSHPLSRLHCPGKNLSSSRGPSTLMHASHLSSWGPHPRQPTRMSGGPRRGSSALSSVTPLPDQRAGSQHTLLHHSARMQAQLQRIRQSLAPPPDA